MLTLDEVQSRMILLFTGDVRDHFSFTWFISARLVRQQQPLCSGFEAEIWFGKHKGGDLYSVAHTTVLWHLVLALVVSLTRCRPLFYNLLQDDQVVHKCSNLTSDSFLFLCCLLCSFICPCVLCSVVRAAIVLFLLLFLCCSFRSPFRSRSLFICCCILCLFLYCCLCSFLCLFLLFPCMLLLCPLVLYRHQGYC